MHDMQKEIEIKSDGKVISRVIFGEELAGVARHLEGYNAIHIVCDGNVAPFAVAVAQAIAALDEDAGQHHCCHEEGAEHHCHNEDEHHCCHGGEDGFQEQGAEHHCCHEEGAEHHCHNEEEHHCCHGGGGCHRRKLLGGRVKSITGIRATEAEKTMETVTAICGRLLEEGADRSSLVLAIGGGITTDMAGFAACIFKRGVRFAYIPTTLLAQVDAAIGGKTGVNYDGLKNMLGVIRQPEFTYICPEVLETLPGREFLCGAAEMLKSFIIKDEGNYEKAVALLKDINAIDEDTITPEEAAKIHETLGKLVFEAAAVKAEIVGRDQFESGERRKLNLGHTFAHAIEKLSEGAIAHGEAVAMGIIQASRLADNAQLTAKLIADFSACGLPTECPYTFDQMAEAMSSDKKAEGGIVHFIVPTAIGTVTQLDLRIEDLMT